MPGGIEGVARRPASFTYSIAVEDEEAWQARLESEGAAVESVVTRRGGAKSIDFRDRYGNLAELITPGLWKND